MKLTTNRLAPGTYHITQELNPAAFYHRHSNELAGVGADAFGQPPQAFQPQVAERFARARLAQIMRHGNHIVGFALYDLLRSGPWRRHAIVD